MIEATNQSSVAFTIPGPPAGKGRPRATTINGMARMYTPKKTASYETLVVMAYQQAGGAKMLGCLNITIEATFAMPLSWSMKKRRVMDGAFCQKKPDSDNILKIVADALNGVAYHDDASIVVASVTKRWGQDGSVKVELGSFFDEAWRQRQRADELTDALRELYESAQLNSVHYLRSSAAFKKAGELLRRIGK